MEPRPAPRAPADPRPERLVEEHGPRIYAMCARLDPDPEEGYQEIWERVLGALERFDPDGSGTIGAWIATIARRHLIDRHRKRGVRGDVVPIDRLPAVEPGVDERIAARQREARVEAALKRLPEAHRRVVVLHHVHGVPLETLATEEGVALGTIKSRLHRGRTRLAELLGGDR